MQEQRAPAVSADAVQNGVTKDAEFYDQYSLQVHGIGQRHDPATCTQPACGHSDHGNSTAGMNLPLVCPTEGCGHRWQPNPMERDSWKCSRCGAKGVSERAGEVYNGQGRPDPNASATPYDPGIAAGGERTIEAIEQRADRDPASFEDWRKLQQEGPTAAHGGGSKSGKKERPQNAVVCTECHLEFCTCAGGEGTKSRRGRRKMIDTDGVHGRSATVAFKVAPPAKTALQRKESAALINELGMALQNGLTLEEARKRLRLSESANAA